MAERGAEVLKNPAFVRAVNLMQNAYTDAWRATATDDTAARELLFVKASVLDEIVSQLGAIIGTGKITAAQLAAMPVRPLR
ncbi:MAG TPA: hypothetical protein VJ840_18765 [Gemmatimonadaceae bacterium]|nr:hypothetical protein [Gemmatimonadaceae bacterium]